MKKTKKPDDYCVKVIEIDSLHYSDGESISYTMDTFMLLLNQEDDDESDELESAQADVVTNSNVDRHNYTAAAHMENFESCSITLHFTYTNGTTLLTMHQSWIETFYYYYYKCIYQLIYRASKLTIMQFFNSFKRI
ncbi:hypothetical protein NC651_037381 [Populus alba x Populus x berolinensis]|nr:hypothetical protein NC651_037381 [Populus alba x Populus x berolinensis]